MGDSLLDVYNLNPSSMEFSFILRGRKKERQSDRQTDKPMGTGEEKKKRSWYSSIIKSYRRELATAVASFDPFFSLSRPLNLLQLS